MNARYFRMTIILPLGLAGCMSGTSVYRDGDPSIIGANCRARRIRYADHILITCKDQSTYEGQFLGTDCRHDSEALLLSRGISKAGGQMSDTQRVEVSSIAEIRYAKAEYAPAGAAVILAVVGVALMLMLAGAGGRWIPD